MSCVRAAQERTARLQWLHTGRVWASAIGIEGLIARAREQTLRRRGDKPADGKERGGSASSYGFECNICLSTAQRPVVTVCGHLYW